MRDAGLWGACLRYRGGLRSWGGGIAAIDLLGFAPRFENLGYPLNAGGDAKIRCDFGLNSVHPGREIPAKTVAYLSDDLYIHMGGKDIADCIFLI